MRFAGIIAAVTANYRKKMMRHIIFHMYEAKTATELAKKINVLDAILWLKFAWDTLQPSTIQKCFSKCGINEDLTTTEPGDEDEPEDEPMTDKFDDLLDDLPVSEYLKIDNDLVTADYLDDEEDEDDDDAGDAVEAAVTVLTAHKASAALQDVLDYSLAKGHEELFEYLSKGMCMIQELK